MKTDDAPLLPESETPFNLIAETDGERRQQEVTARRLEAKREEILAAQNAGLQTTLF